MANAEPGRAGLAVDEDARLIARHWNAPALSCGRPSFSGVGPYDGKCGTSQLSRRGPGARPDPVRGGSLLHRGARLARRRSRQNRKPHWRRTWPDLVRRPSGQPQLVLFLRIQRQQEIGHRQPQIRARPGAGQGHGEEGRRHDREHGARNGRAAGARLRGDPRAEPGHHLCPGQGLWRGQPVRKEPRL